MSTLPRPAAVRAPAQAPRLFLFGSFRLLVGGEPVVLALGAQRLLALLSLRDRMSRRQVSGTLWPETTTGQALTNLRHVLWRLQHAVPDEDLVDAVGADLQLSGDVRADVRGLLAGALPALDTGLDPGGVDLLRSEATDLLPDWDDEWLVDDRERLRQLRLHVLERRVEALVTEGHFGRAMEAALAALRTDVLRESAHRAVIQVHLAEGNLSEARRAFAACRRVLRAEIGVDPSPAIRALVGFAG